jgi:hypothetical protein
MPKLGAAFSANWGKRTQNSGRVAGGLSRGRGLTDPTSDAALKVFIGYEFLLMAPSLSVR